MIKPNTATAIKAETREAALLVPEAAPAKRASTAFKTAVVSGATLTAATGTRLELRVTGDPARAVQIVSGIAGVDEASVRGDLVVVKGTGPDLGRRVSAAVVDAGIGLLEQRVASSGTLEEAYLNLVRE